MVDKPTSNIERLEAWISEHSEVRDSVTQGQVQQSLWNILNAEQRRLAERFNETVARQRTRGFAAYIRRGIPFDRHRLFDLNLNRQGLERWTESWTGKPIGIFRVPRYPAGTVIDGKKVGGRFMVGARTMIKPHWKGDDTAIERILGK